MLRVGHINYKNKHSNIKLGLGQGVRGDRGGRRGEWSQKSFIENATFMAHIIGSTSWPKKKNIQYHLSGIVVDLLGAHFLPMGKSKIQPRGPVGGTLTK